MFEYDGKPTYEICVYVVDGFIGVVVFVDVFHYSGKVCPNGVSDCVFS